MAPRNKIAPRDYFVGKNRPPQATRWKKGQSGNPRGKSRRPPSEAELIERLFRRRVPVIEGGVEVWKSGLTIIFMQILAQESAGSRRAGRTRDRYQAFAREHEGIDGVALRYVASAPAPDSALRAGLARVAVRAPMDSAPSPDAQAHKGGAQAPADASAPGGVGDPGSRHPTERRS